MPTGTQPGWQGWALGSRPTAVGLRLWGRGFFPLSPSCTSSSVSPPLCPPLLFPLHLVLPPPCLGPGAGPPAGSLLGPTGPRNQGGGSWAVSRYMLIIGSRNCGRLRSCRYAQPGTRGRAGGLWRALGERGGFFLPQLELPPGPGLPPGPPSRASRVYPTPGATEARALSTLFQGHGQGEVATAGPP